MVDVLPASHDPHARARGDHERQSQSVAQSLQSSVYSRGSCSSSVPFPYRGRLLHIQTSAAFPSTSGPLFPPGSGDRPQVSHHSAADIKVREERRMPVDTSVLLPAGIGVFYTLLVLVSILVSLKLTAQKSKAIQVGSEIAEINFALQEEQTIVGVMDTKNVMRFYIGNDVIDKKRYEEQRQ